MFDDSCHVIASLQPIWGSVALCQDANYAHIMAACPYGFARWLPLAFEQGVADVLPVNRQRNNAQRFRRTRQAKAILSVV